MGLLYQCLPTLHVLCGISTFLWVQEVIDTTTTRPFDRQVSQDPSFFRLQLHFTPYIVWRLVGHAFFANHVEVRVHYTLGNITRQRHILNSSPAGLSGLNRPAVSLIGHRLLDSTRLDSTPPRLNSTSHFFPPPPDASQRNMHIRCIYDILAQSATSHFVRSHASHHRDISHVYLQ